MSIRDSRCLWGLILTGLCLAAATAGAGADPPRKPSRRIAVLPLKNLRPGTGTDWIGAGACETLTTKLTGVPGLLAVERAQVQRALDEQAFQKLDIVDPASAVKVGKFLAAERIVIGTFLAADGNVLFNVRVVDVETAAILNSASVTAPRKKIFDAFYQLAEAVIDSFDRKAVIVDARPIVTPAPRRERIVLTAEQRKDLRKRGTTNTQAYVVFLTAGWASSLKERIRLYDRAIKLDPTYAWAYHNRGFVYYKLGEYLLAIQNYDKALELNPALAMGYLNRGNVYVKKREYARAVRNFDAAIRLNPDFAQAYCNRGICRIHLGKDAKAAEDLNASLRLNPNSAIAHAALGSIHEFKLNVTEAKKHYDRAIELNPKYAWAYRHRGSLQFYFRDIPAAIRDYGKAIELEPGNALAHGGRASGYRRTGQYAKAIPDYAKAIALSKKPGVGLYRDRAECHMKLKQYRKAVADLSEAIRLKPTWHYDRQDRAKCYFHLAEYDKAWEDVRALRKAGKKVDPQFLVDLRRATGQMD